MNFATSAEWGPWIKKQKQNNVYFVRSDQRGSKASEEKLKERGVAFCTCNLARWEGVAFRNKIFCLNWKLCRSWVANLPSSTDNAARVNVSRNAFISSQAWMTRKFWRRHRGTKQINSGLAWSALLSTTIFVIAVTKICCGLTRLRSASPEHFNHCDVWYNFR